jgi:hypothetical protein
MYYYQWASNDCNIIRESGVRTHNQTTTPAIQMKPPLTALSHSLLIVSDHSCAVSPDFSLPVASQVKPTVFMEMHLYLISPGSPTPKQVRGCLAGVHLGHVWKLFDFILVGWAILLPRS